MARDEEVMVGSENDDDIEVEVGSATVVGTTLSPTCLLSS